MKRNAKIKIVDIKIDTTSNKSADASATSSKLQDGCKHTLDRARVVVEFIG